eukprot:CAMPEP_0116142726 /NCGR_PEP_ID=MMETSP0329-20121206/15063_1 /TAXON_ID=697910 /ORGANISM="Pseudo-nitzschia arenysensis, Strain B593" /LENGTH=820 /DNA_ID=CAMNT_0003637983 /DNA_START=112 /DNA_END=2575 /DNA_ORIENTATION=-
MTGKMGSTTKAPVTISINLSSQSGNAHNNNSKENKSSKLGLLWGIFRLVVLDGGLTLLFAAFVFVVVLHKLHDDYLHPQLQLMVFQEEGRRYTDTTYYHRVCDHDDLTASSPEELIIQDHHTKADTVDHMLTHGASIYPNLLTNETAHELREWIAIENYKRAQWNVIEAENRFTWGIDINAHPKLQTFFQELAANEQLRNGLEGICGPDPAVIEFTAITSSYGATDQYIHADIIHSGSPVKYARSFAPSYSLFVPLQDTTYEMGATHVCPGSHVCSDAEEPCIDGGAFAVSGAGEGNMWPMGSGALVNQQTYHRGMGFTQKGAVDRVVLIATFAPRPNTHRGVETRQIGQGGSYSLLWHQWGHTLSDYVHADKRMTEPQKTLRSLGLINGKGWNYISTLSMRMANEDTEMKSDDLEELLEEEDGLWFLPRSWQEINEESDISEYHAFGVGVMKRVEKEFKRFYLMGLGAYVSLFSVLVMIQRVVGIGKVSRQSKLSISFHFLFRIALLHAPIVFLAWFGLNTVENSNWGKSIRNRKMYRIPLTHADDPTHGTIPDRDDILNASHYSSDYMASYSQLLDVAHPGNAYWKSLVKTHAASYNVFTKTMKKEFCGMLVVKATEERRFLKQDQERFWTEIVDIDELIQMCHRELTTAYDPLLANLFSQIESLKSETQFGRFRLTAMQSKTIPDYLRYWESQLLEKYSKSDDLTQTLPTNEKKSEEKTKFGKTISSQIGVEVSTMSESFTFRNRTIPELPDRSEPFEGAWLKEGDRVFALYECNFDNDEWYPGIITAAIPNDGTYDIAFDDGDIGEDLEAIASGVR